MYSFATNNICPVSCESEKQNFLFLTKSNRTNTFRNRQVRLIIPQNKSCFCVKLSKCLYFQTSKDFMFFKCTHNPEKYILFTRQLSILRVRRGYFLYATTTFININNRSVCISKTASKQVIASNFPTECRR